MPKPAASRPPPAEPRSSLPPPSPGSPQRTGYAGWVMLGLMLAGFALYKHYGSEADPQPAIAYTSFYRQVADEKVESVTLRGLNVLGKFKAATDVEGHKLSTFRSMVPAQEDRDLLPLLREKGVKVEVQSEEPPRAIQLLSAVLPFLLIAGLWIFLSRRAQTMMGPGGPLTPLRKGSGGERQIRRRGGAQDAQARSTRDRRFSERAHPLSAAGRQGP